MPTDFRASQIQTNKIIASGSTGTATNALLLIYPISKQSGSNQGFINTGSFGLGGIGTDIFMFVSGAIGAKDSGNTNAITVFGGDVHVSGNITGGNQFWKSTTQGTIFTTGSVEITGSLTLSSGSQSNTQRIQMRTIPNGSASLLNSEFNSWLTIKAANITASGSGGTLVLSGGDGGYVSSSAESPVANGGDVILVGGNVGTTLGGGGGGSLSEGGSVLVFATSGSNNGFDQIRTPGGGGGFFVTAGSGGSSSLDPTIDVTDGGTGGPIYLLAGAGGVQNVFSNGAVVGQGGSGGAVVVNAGPGGSCKAENVGGPGGSIDIVGGAGGDAVGPGSTAGAGGNINITAGASGLSSSLRTGVAGNISLFGGTVRTTNLNVSGSLVTIGGTFGGATTLQHRRVYINEFALDSFSKGNDVLFFVSGTITTGSSVNNRASVFGGYVVVSGALRVGNSSSNYITQSGGNMTFFDTAVSGATLAKMIRTFLPIGYYTVTNLLVGSPQVAGQMVLSQSEVGSNDIRLRSVLSSTDTTASASVRLYNVTSGSYVEIGGAGVTTQSTTSTSPVQVQSVNLINAVNFGTGANIYEVQVFTNDSSKQAILGSSVFVCI